MKKCPFCAEEIQEAALVCRYCQRDLPQASGADVKAVVTPLGQWREAAKLNLEIKALNSSLSGRAEAEKLIQDNVRVLDVADGLDEAARVASDVKQCDQPAAIANAWAKLKQARPTDESWHAALAAAGRLEVCRKSTERQLSAGLQKIMMAQREAWSQKTDTVFLDNGMNVAISFAGANKDRATLKWALMSRAAAHKLTDGGSMDPSSFLGGLQKIGFRRVTFTDGYDESWSYTLEPDNESNGGKLVLGQHGLGEPLTLAR